MNANLLVSLMPVIVSCVLFAISLIVLAVVLKQRARIRRDSRFLSDRMKRLSQSDIDCARS